MIEIMLAQMMPLNSRSLVVGGFFEIASAEERVEFIEGPLSLTINRTLFRVDPVLIRRSDPVEVHLQGVPVHGCEEHVEKGFRRSIGCSCLPQRLGILLAFLVVFHVIMDIVHIRIVIEFEAVLIEIFHVLSQLLSPLVAHGFPSIGRVSFLVVRTQTTCRSIVVPRRLAFSSHRLPR